MRQHLDGASHHEPSSLQFAMQSASQGVEMGCSLHLVTQTWASNHWGSESNLVDSASSHTLVSKIKPCMSKYNSFTLKTANGSLYQL